jgi:hypothetical protein
MKSSLRRRNLARSFRRRRGSAARIILGLLAVSGLAAGGYWWYTQQYGGEYGNSSNEPLLHSVAQGPFDHIVLEQGEIESSSNNEVKCEVKGRGGSGTPILTVIPEGTFVKKGEQLCQLDSSALEQEAKNHSPNHYLERVGKVSCGNNQRK